MAWADKIMGAGWYPSEDSADYAAVSSRRVKRGSRHPLGDRSGSRTALPSNRVRLSTACMIVYWSSRQSRPRAMADDRWWYSLPSVPCKSEQKNVKLYHYLRLLFLD
jgi:hypothetical protein